MHMFKKHDQPPVPPEPRGQDISAPFQTSNAKSPSAYGASRFPVTHSPTVDDRSPGAYARRSILRNSHGPVPGASSMPVYSYAASPHGTPAHGGSTSMTFIPASPSSPAFYPGLNAVTSTWNHAEARQSGIPATMSLPQMAPHAQEYHYGGPVSFGSTNALSNPYESSFASSAPTRASVPCIVRPLNVRKNPPFPFPSEAAALHTLARVLRTETKKFRITDFIDIEEGEFAALVEAKEREKGHDATPYVHRMQMQDPRMRRKSMWDGEEETETVMDCVRDKMDDEGGGASRWKSERMERSEKRRREREMRFKDLHLFGTHLEDLPEFALSPVIIGGYLHEVPTAVAAAIEELVISRLNEPNFFNSRPDRTQLFELVSRFDQLVTANASHGRLVPPPSLSNESTQSIYSLLVTYLSALPHAIIPRPLVDALWCWCVSPSVTRAQRARIVRNDPEASESEHETSEEEEDHVNYAERLRQREREFLDLPSFRVQVRVARHLLLLLSRRQFSLLVYLMTFIRAVLRLDGDSDKEGDQTSSGVALHDIARAFGGVLLGGRDWKKRSSIKYRDGLPVNGDRDRTSKEQKIMTWLVNHWGRIASAYELDEGPGEKLGQGSRPRATSMPVKGPEPTRSSLDEQHNNGESKASGHKGSSLSQVVSSVRDEREESKQNPSGQLNRLPSSECESLTSGDTAGSACSSDWEELPIVSAHPTHSNGKILSLPKDGKTEPGQQVLSTLLARQAEEEDILEYYNGDSRGHTSGMSASEGDCGNADLDDDSSVYSNDNALQEHQSRDLADHRSAKQDCTEKTAAAAEIYALRKQLRQALDERDQARKVVDDIRVVVDRAQV